jgi:hypothetical protein
VAVVAVVEIQTHQVVLELVEVDHSLPLASAEQQTEVVVEAELAQQTLALQTVQVPLEELVGQEL